MRRSETEAGDELARGEERKEVVLLLLGAIAHEQLARTKRVRNYSISILLFKSIQYCIYNKKLVYTGDGARGRAGSRGDLLDDHGVAVGGETLASELLGDDHAEEALLLAPAPELLREVSVLSDGIVVHDLT